MNKNAQYSLKWGMNNYFPLCPLYTESGRSGVSNTSQLSAKSGHSTIELRGGALRRPVLERLVRYSINDLNLKDYCE